MLKEACLNDAKDVREMGWSLLAPHPLENKAPVLMAAIERGSDAVLTETFSEMGRTPELPLFEAMLTAANRVQDARQARVFSELQTWLKAWRRLGANVQERERDEHLVGSQQAAL